MNRISKALRRLSAVALLAPAWFLLSACGFQPLYATPVYSDLAGVEIETGDTRLDYLIADALEEEFGAGQAPYRLVVDTISRERGIGVSADARVRRYAIEMTSNYVLSHGADRILQSTVSERVYFYVPDDPYALVSARLTAEQQGAEALARRLARSVALGIRRGEAGLEPHGED